MAQWIERDVESHRLAKLLKFQIQQCLNQQYHDRFRVRTYEAIRRNSSLQPAISVLKANDRGSSVCWVIDILNELSSALEKSDTNSRLYAQLDIADYWSLAPSQSELRAYSLPTQSGYQQRHLFHIGEQASPTSAPEITLKVQEPLPLNFLTRTLHGQRTYTATTPPLQACSVTFQPGA